MLCIVSMYAILAFSVAVEALVDFDNYCILLDSTKKQHCLLGVPPKLGHLRAVGIEKAFTQYSGCSGLLQL